jgi:Tfp pilus assembly protein PilF
MCHHQGGGGPFSVITYADAKAHAEEIAQATRTHHMPPWLPEHGYGEFDGEDRLQERQIGAIAAWVRGGAPEGPVTELPAPPSFTDGWQLGSPDLIVEAPRAVSVPPSGPDVFWNFVLDPGLKSSRFVRAIEIRTGNNRMIHHANVLIDPARSARSHEPTPGGGFAGMDIAVEAPPLEFPSHFLFWKPGNVPRSEPEGYSWRLDPGADLVLNTHLKPDGRPEEVRPSVGLYFTSQKPTHFPLLIQLEADQQLNIPPGSRAFPVADDFELPVDSDVLAIYPHAHYLGKLLEAYATLPSGERRWLIRIPDWDPDCQAVYRYREPVFLPKGSIVSMRYRYDNSSANPNNPNRPPKRVRAGNQATDEMAHLWLQLLPRGVGDSRTAIEAALMRHRIAKNPADFSAHLELGGLLVATLRAQEALPILAEAVRLNPRHAEARNFYGESLAAAGRTIEASAQFEVALQLRPDYPNARLNLANAEVKSGRLDDAIENYRRILSELPDDSVAKERLERAQTLKAGR